MVYKWPPFPPNMASVGAYFQSSNRFHRFQNAESPTLASWSQWGVDAPFTPSVGGPPSGRPPWFWTTLFWHGLELWDRTVVSVFFVGDRWRMLMLCGHGQHGSNTSNVKIATGRQWCGIGSNGANVTVTGYGCHGIVIDLVGGGGNVSMFLLSIKMLILYTWIGGIAGRGTDDSTVPCKILGSTAINGIASVKPHHGFYMKLLLLLETIWYILRKYVVRRLSAMI